MPSPPPPAYTVEDVPKAQESLPTPSTASTSVKRERSTSPVTSESGRDAKRANLGDIMNAKVGESPTEEVKKETETEVETTRESQPELPTMGNSDGQRLEVSTDIEASAPR